MMAKNKVIPRRIHTPPSMGTTRIAPGSVAETDGDKIKTIRGNSTVDLYT